MCRFELGQRKPLPDVSTGGARCWPVGTDRKARYSRNASVSELFPGRIDRPQAAPPGSFSFVVSQLFAFAKNGLLWATSDAAAFADLPCPARAASIRL